MTYKVITSNNDSHAGTDCDSESEKLNSLAKQGWKVISAFPSVAFGQSVIVYVLEKA